MKKKGVTGGTPLSFTSHSSSTSSWLASIDLTQEMLDEESREKLKGKMKQLKSKLKKGREFHMAILASYEEETVLDMEEIRYGMHLYGYKQKIWQCEILLAHTGSIQNLKFLLLWLALFSLLLVLLSVMSIVKYPGYYK